MSHAPASEDWATSRGERWRTHLEGLEAQLAPVNDPLLEALDLDSAGRIADVGCGGGASTLAIAGAVAPGTVVHGFDLSPALVDAARERIPADDTSITFAVADVGTSPAPREPYGRLASRFGTMFFADPASAFANLREWLAPGGRFAFAVWAGPADNPWLTSPRDAVATVTDTSATEPDAPGPFRYADADILVALLAEAGFANLDIRAWESSLQVGGGLPAAEAARFAIGSSSASAALDDAGDGARRSAVELLTETFAEYERDGVVTMPAHAHIVTGGFSAPRADASGPPATARPPRGTDRGRRP
ncbi:MAG: class I SAM-dependent methyltransferase [Solirubrobacterales bacterium]